MDQRDDGRSGRATISTSEQEDPLGRAVLHNTEAMSGSQTLRTTDNKGLKEGMNSGQQYLANDAPAATTSKHKIPYTTSIEARPGRKDDIEVSGQVLGCIKALCVGWACVLVSFLFYALVVHTKDNCEDRNDEAFQEVGGEPEYDERTCLLGRDAY